MVTSTDQGVPGDAINVGLIGTKEDVVSAFHATGWYPVAEMLRDDGYATAIFGKWHFGAQPYYSLPQNKGFDEFYGIPPALTWDAFLMTPQGLQTKTLDIPLDKGPQIVEAKRGEPLKAVKPYTAEVRREIDSGKLADRGVDFMRRQKAAGKLFFLYLPISRAIS